MIKILVSLVDGLILLLLPPFVESAISYSPISSSVYSLIYCLEVLDYISV